MNRERQSTLPIGDARPYFVFALILATLALFVAVIPSIAHGQAPFAPTKGELSAIRASIAPLLVDADSAKLQDVAVSNGKVCGKVNAKNSLGGYVGYQTFFVDLTDRNAMVQIDSPVEYAYAAATCHKLGM